MVDCLFFVDMLVSFDTAFWDDGNIVTSRSVNEIKKYLHAVHGFRVVFSRVINAPFHDECSINLQRGRVKTEYTESASGDTTRVFCL